MLLLRALIAAFFLALAAPASAQVYYLAPVASLPGGSNSNDCLSKRAPCLTWQYVIDLCAKICTVYVAPGTYAESPSVNYYKFVSFIGDCAILNPAAVILDGVFTVQDHGIGGLTCVRAKGVYSRQFAIIDYYFIEFAANTGGIHVNASENSKINCLGGDYAVGNAAYHYAATGGSTIIASCGLTMIGSRNFDAMAYSMQQSRINAGGMTGSGGAVTFNIAKCILASYSIVEGASNMPGTGSGC